MDAPEVFHNAMAMDQQLLIEKVLMNDETIDEPYRLVESSFGIAD